MLLWIFIIAAISIIWALIALKRERSKKEIEMVKEDITKNRVIFHSSDVSDSSSS